MRNFKSILTIFGFALLIFALPTLVSAQWRDDDDDDNNRNRNGSSNNRYLEQTIKRVKQDSKNFERQVERDRYNNNNYLENLSENFKEAADDLEDEFNSRNLNRSYDEAQQLVRAAEQIDRELGNNNNRRGNNNGNNDNYVYNQWRNIQRDVKQIADAYNIRYKTNNGWWNRGGGRGNGNGNGNGNGRIKDKIKNFPLPF